MPPKPIRNPRFDDAYIVRLKIVAAAEEWCEKTGHPHREAWRRIAFYTRKQIIKPFPTVESFEDFRMRNREEIARYRAEENGATENFFRAPSQRNRVSRETVEGSGYRVIDDDAPNTDICALESRDFVRRAVKSLRAMLRHDDTALPRLLYDYARLLAGVQPDRRSRAFRWKVYQDLLNEDIAVTGRAAAVEDGESGPRCVG